MYNLGDKVRMSKAGLERWVVDSYEVYDIHEDTYHEEFEFDENNPVDMDGKVIEVYEEGWLTDEGFLCRVQWYNGKTNSYMAGDLEVVA